MKVAPSILAADFLNLQEDLNRLNNSSCDYIHLDVMDGNFVKGITFGSSLIKEIKNKTTKKLDVHLMHAHPTFIIKELLDIGVDIITVHAEILNNIEVYDLLKMCQDKGVKFGLAFCPETSVNYYEELIEEIDFALIMSVQPGKGGQKFMPEVLYKVEDIRKINSDMFISIDGGITSDTIKFVGETSIDMVVAGTYIFKGNMEENIKILQSNV